MTNTEILDWLEGHVAQFPGMKVYPHKFISKHYPIRSQQHGERKVFTERRPRFSPQEQFGKQWHAQYDHVKLGHNFLANPKDLVEFDPARWMTDGPLTTTVDRKEDLDHVHH